MSDTGSFVGETPTHSPIKFFDSTEVTAEEMEQFVRDYHQSTPPDEWPRRIQDSSLSESDGDYSLGEIDQKSGFVDK